jgi:hypothetical protein
MIRRKTNKTVGAGWGESLTEDRKCCGSISPRQCPVVLLVTSRGGKTMKSEVKHEVSMKLL